MASNLNKKQQRAKNALNRVTVDMNLSTRVFKSVRDYDRNKSKRELRKEIVNYG